MYTSKQRILLIDDESFNLYSLKIIIEGSLKKIGKDPKCLENFIDIAGNGEEAINLF